MAFEYLGIVNNIVTNKQICDITNFTEGTYVSADEIDLSFHKFKDGNRYILFCNDFIKYNIRWNTLNTLGIVYGANFPINGKDCKIRLIKGGNADPATEAGGEWVDLLVNLANITTADTSYYTLCQEARSAYSSYAIAIGYSSSVTKFNYIFKSSTSTSIRWRPVLEYEILCDSSLSDTSLGEIMQFNEIPFTTSGENYNVIKKLDGLEVERKINQAGNLKQTLDLSDRWNDIDYGEHTITIEVEPNNFSEDIPFWKSISTIKFTKVKKPISLVPSNLDLVTTLNYVKELKEEISFQKSKLAKAISDRHIEASINDTLSKLTTDANNLLLYDVVAGISNVVHTLPKFKIESRTETVFAERLDITWNGRGMVYCKSYAYSGEYANYTSIIIYLYSNDGSLIERKGFLNYSATDTLTHSYDFKATKGDYIKVTGYHTNSGSYVTDFTVGFDVKVYA